MSLTYNLDQFNEGFKEYLHIQEIRNLKGYFQSVECDRRYTRLLSNIPGVIEDTLNEYLLFEKKHNHRNFKGGKVKTKKYQHVQGYCLTYMLPKETYSLSTLNRIIREIMFEITQGEILPYVSYLAKLGEGNYLRLFVLDREQQSGQPKRYLQDEIRDAQGKRRRADYPGAIVIGRKGDIVLDKNGEIIYLDGFKQTKSRIFKEQYNQLWTRFKQIFLSILVKNIKNIKQVYNFKRDQVYKSIKKESITIARRRNQIKRLMERWINFVISKEKRSPSYRDIMQGYDRNDAVLTNKGELAISLFYKTKNRFEKGFFTLNNQQHPIFKANYSEVLINLELLKHDFMSEINSILLN